jgi:hypothetical protein
LTAKKTSFNADWKNNKFPLILRRCRSKRVPNQLKQMCTKNQKHFWKIWARHVTERWRLADFCACACAYTRASVYISVCEVLPIIITWIHERLASRSSIIGNNIQRKLLVDMAQHDFFGIPVANWIRSSTSAKVTLEAQVEFQSFSISHLRVGANRNLKPPWNYL